VLTLGLILHRYDLTPEDGYRLRIAETITLKPRDCGSRWANDTHRRDCRQPIVI
jgi:hypothetical protein